MRWLATTWLAGNATGLRRASREGDLDVVILHTQTMLPWAQESPRFKSVSGMYGVVMLDFIPSLHPIICCLLSAHVITCDL